MSKHTLNRNEPHATIFGDDQGRHFEQDGKFFTQDGKLWRDPAHKETAEEKKAREAQEKADAEAAAKAAEEAKKAQSNDGQLSAQLSTENIGGGKA